MSLLKSERADILRVARGYGATNIRVFGPGVHGDGELGLLVDMEPDRSLFDLVDLGQELGVLLGRPVEVLAAASLSPRLRASILAEARAL